MLYEQLAIFAGGLGTRLGSLTEHKPKPMVQVGQFPLIYWIMLHYSRFGVRRFVIAAGYQAHEIKRYFSEFHLNAKHLTFTLKEKKIDTHSFEIPDWEIEVIDTGENTLTGLRLEKIRHRLYEKGFFLTYGDGLANVDIAAAFTLHSKSNRPLTMTAVTPPSRYGFLNMDGDQVQSFEEKPANSHDLINGGFMICDPAIWDTFDGSDEMLETGPLRRLVATQQVTGYIHSGFWQSVDTPRDLEKVRALLDESRPGLPPWLI